MKIFLHKWMMAILCVCCCAFVYAVDESQSAQQQASANATNSFQNYIRNISTLTTEFQQEIRDDKGKVLQRSTGTMYLKRPKLFRFETKTPTKQLIVADGKKLWLYDPELEQVTVKPLQEAIANTPALILTGDLSSFQRDYNIQYFKDNNKEIFILLPKHNESFKSIKFVFEYGELKQMVMLDQLDQKTQIDFVKLILNKSIPEKLFHFQPPKGVDVMRS